MSLIYEPKGKAREYSPLAVNLYNGCDHGCVYCYVLNILKMHKDKFLLVKPKENVLSKLRRDAKKYYNTDKQVLMSFSTDPYNHLNDKLKLTRKALQIFLNNRIPTAILTKAGMRATQDSDVIGKFKNSIRIGTTLTLDNRADSLRVEPNAALPGKRIEMLRFFHDRGIKTFVSFEPILSMKQLENLFYRALEHTDEMMLGLLSGKDVQIDINKLGELIEVARLNNKKIYVKRSLQYNFKKGFLSMNETDSDYLCAEQFVNQSVGLFE